MVFARSDGVDAILYQDPGRPFLLFPFWLAHLLGPDSMTAVNWVIAGYVYVAALLTYALAYLLLKRSLMAGAIAACVAISFGADASSALFSMVIMWQAVIGILVCALAVRKSMTDGLTLLRAVTAVAGAALALWTYEASVFPLAGLALLPLTISPVRWSRIGLALAPLCGVVVVFSAMTISRLQTGVGFYQLEKFDGLPSLAEASHRYSTWLTQVFTPQDWPTTWMDGWFKACRDAATSHLTSLSIAVAISAAIIFVCLGRLETPSLASRFPSAGGLVRVAILGVGLVLASYAPYVFIADGTANWRTHFFAQPFWGLLLATATVALARIGTAFVVATGCLAGALIGWGAFTNLWGQLENAARWDNTRQVMLDVTRAVPSVKPKTTLVIDGIGKPLSSLCRSASTPDPFGDPWWLQSNLALYYPLTTPWGTYVRSGEPPPLATSTGLVVAGKTIPWSSLVILEPDRLDRLTVARSVPARLRPEGAAARGYAPFARITPGQDRVSLRVRENLRLVPSFLP